MKFEAIGVFVLERILEPKRQEVALWNLYGLQDGLDHSASLSHNAAAATALIPLPTPLTSPHALTKIFGLKSQPYSG
jgi:hypothetical protein